jgi:hypothetical protein
MPDTDKSANPIDTITRTGAPLILRERDAGHYLGLSQAFLRRARATGRGPAFVRVRRTVLYRLADLDAWLARHLVVTDDAGNR